MPINHNGFSCLPARDIWLFSRGLVTIKGIEPVCPLGLCDLRLEQWKCAVSLLFIHPKRALAFFGLVSFIKRFVVNVFIVDLNNMKKNNKTDVNWPTTKKLKRNCNSNFLFLFFVSMFFLKSFFPSLYICMLLWSTSHTRFKLWKANYLAYLTLLVFCLSLLIWQWALQECWV